MKNKKLLYILITIITFFSYNLTVNAAQELTCMYEKPGALNVNVEKVIFIQYSSGEKAVYTNYSDARIDAFGWKLNQNVEFNLEKVNTTEKDSNNNLTTCPEYSNFSGSEIKLRSNKKVGFEKLEKNFQSVKEPVYTDVSTPTTPNNHWLNELNENDEKYTGSCRYTHEIDGSSEPHVIQINFGKEYMLITEYDPEKGEHSGKKEYLNSIEETNSEGYITYTTGYNYDFSVEAEYSISHFLSIYGGNCPALINVARGKDDSMAGANFQHYIINTNILADKKNGVAYYIDEENGTRGINPLTGEKLTWGGNFNVGFEEVKIENCADLVGETIAGYFNVIWNIIKFGIPILLIGLGTLDFAQATFSGKEDGMKKAQEKFIKRIIIAVIIFLIPTILTFLLKIANDIWGNLGADLCGIIF